MGDATQVHQVLLCVFRTDCGGCGAARLWWEAEGIVVWECDAVAPCSCGAVKLCN